ncbi:arginine and glutamate-rich protein 1-B-like [Rhopilema esculentum]|uniref:arginine and glutamate-rich protein 1-B-like n=1 Tax=Rhopilema esculentum TaxID=499914 RepID=UPI0031E0B9E9|eukprot:gene13051-3827_t
MARSRSRSREKSRRKHSSSDESDYDRRKRDNKKKRRRSRSRSRSANSDRRKHKSGSTHYRSSGHGSSHSRSSSRAEKRAEKSQYSRRNRSRSRSPSDKRRRDRSKSRSPEERRRREKEERNKDGHNKKETSADIRKDVTAEKDGKISLKERVANLIETSSRNLSELCSANSATFDVDKEKIAEIEAQGFHQQTFVSNMNKKEPVTQNDNSQNYQMSTKSDSHENAIFGSSTSTFTPAPSSRIVPTNGSKATKDDDDLFGPSLLIDQNLRTERWLQKLTFIRQKILREAR